MLILLLFCCGTIVFFSCAGGFLCEIRFICNGVGAVCTREL